MNSKIDIQIDEIQISTAQQIDSALENIEKVIRVLELNEKKPEVAYRHIMEAKWKLKNLATDLKADC